MTLLEYPVTRSVHLSLSQKLALIATALLWIAMVTIINVIAVGYELVPVTSTTFKGAISLWYDNLLPETWRPKSRICRGSVIKQQEGTLPRE